MVAFVLVILAGTSHIEAQHATAASFQVGTIVSITNNRHDFRIEDPQGRKVGGPLTTVYVLEVESADAIYLFACNVGKCKMKWKVGDSVEFLRRDSDARFKTSTGKEEKLQIIKVFQKSHNNSCGLQGGGQTMRNLVIMVVMAASTFALGQQTSTTERPGMMINATANRAS